MRHYKRVKKLSRPSKHRKALIRNLARALIEKEEIKTTLTKAKALSSFMDKLISLSLKADLASRRRALRYLPDRNLIHKLFAEIASNYGNDASGGYTRVLKLGRRQGDGAELALISFTFSHTEAKK